MYFFEDRIDLIKKHCMQEQSNDPIEILNNIMKQDFISIHGPEHHILDGAAFLTALHNAGEEFDLEEALDEMIKRGKQIPGAICGFWGVCGSSASIGAALAIIHKTGPVSDTEYFKHNMEYVSKALKSLSKIGGPRCCKRNAYLSTLAAISFVKEKYGIELGKSKITCDFSGYNNQCIGTKCPFNRGA